MIYIKYDTGKMDQYCPKELQDKVAVFYVEKDHRRDFAAGVLGLHAL